MKIKKDDLILDVSEKAYKIAYKHRGFKPYVEEKKDLTKKEIISELEARNIEYNSSSNKAELLELLNESDN